MKNDDLAGELRLTLSGMLWLDKRCCNFIPFLCGEFWEVQNTLYQRPTACGGEARFIFTALNAAALELKARPLRFKNRKAAPYQGVRFEVWANNMIIAAQDSETLSALLPNIDSSREYRWRVKFLDNDGIWTE